MYICIDNIYIYIEIYHAWVQACVQFTFMYIPMATSMPMPSMKAFASVSCFLLLALLSPSSSFASVELQLLFLPLFTQNL